MFPGTENVEPTNFQTCWNLVAASRRERREKEKKKEIEEREKRIEEMILMQEGKETSETADNNEYDSVLKNETTENNNEHQRTKSKVQFKDSAENKNANNDFPENANFEVPRELTLNGILDSIEKEEDTEMKKCK